jgi:hypothetical protein
MCAGYTLKSQLVLLDAQRPLCSVGHQLFLSVLLVYRYCGTSNRQALFTQISDSKLHCIVRTTEDKIK